MSKYMTSYFQARKSNLWPSTTIVIKFRNKRHANQLYQFSKNGLCNNALKKIGYGQVLKLENGGKN